MLSNREKATVMIQSSLILAERPMSAKDVFMTTKEALKNLDLNITDREYIKIFNDILQFNEVDIERLSFQITNR